MKSILIIMFVGVFLISCSTATKQSYNENRIGVIYKINKNKLKLYYVPIGKDYSFITNINTSFLEISYDGF